MKLKDLIRKDKKGSDILLNLRLRKKREGNPNVDKEPNSEDGCDPDMSGGVPDEEQPQF